MKSKKTFRFSLFSVSLSLLLAFLLVSQALSAPDAPGLAVTQVLPQGDASHPFDNLEIQFNAPVMAGSFTLEDIVFTGPGGPIVPTSLAALSEDRYLLALTGLTGLDIYRLDIGPEVRDQANQPMDQNQDGAPGQPGDAYQAALFAKAATLVDDSYDSLYLVVYGNTLTLDGLHHFAGVSLLGNGQLTHPAATADTEYRLELVITDTLYIETGAKIDVCGRGYLGGYTLGNTTTGGAIGSAGGSYGGLGHPGSIAGSQTNQVYGDYRNPDEPGSGGGELDVYHGTAGGGLVRISVSSAVVNGSILANGVNTPKFYAAGSGGGIYLSTTSLSGSGLITAHGGTGYGEPGYSGGSGGGGRVAIYYTTLQGFDPTAQAQAHGGSYLTTPAAAGTVYLKQQGGEGVLRIDSHGSRTGQWTPLGIPSDAQFEVDHLLLSGAGVIAAPQYEMPILANNLSLLDGAMLTHQPATTTEVFSLQMTITDTLTISATAKIDVSGRGYLGGYTNGNTTTGGATGSAGGSYGGLGHPGSIAGSQTNQVYGDYRNPDEPGSGGGELDVYHGTAGGGLVRISVSSAVVNGSILANGVNTPKFYAAGSGGGIYLSTTSLSGSGLITAHGGTGYGEPGYSGGSGGGGRVAIYYTTLQGFDPAAQAQAHGGSYLTTPAAAGTVYIKQQGGEGVLRIDSHGSRTGQWTPLGVSSDTQFEVDHLLLSGVGVIVAPQHEMPILANNLSLLDGAMLTHQPATAQAAYSLRLTVADTLWISATAKIDVSGRGYLGGYTNGNTTTGGATGSAGGSYGGLGHPGAIEGSTVIPQTNQVYGDYRNPDEPGSGGGPGLTGSGNPGGGLARIQAETAIINGSILADGIKGWPPSYPGSSGGGIYLSVASLSGNGLITAQGGNAYEASECRGGSGGGGRVAIYYTTLQGFDPAAQAQAHGGSSINTSAAAGTVYIKQQGGEGVLRIDNHGSKTGQWTPLGIPSDTQFEVDHLLLSGAGVIAAPQHEMPILANNLSLLDGAMLTHQPATTTQVFSLQMTVTETLSISATAKIDVSGRGYLGGYTNGNTTTGGATGSAGGSYGGLGHLGNATDSRVNRVYGISQYPNEPGSGGGPWPTGSGNPGGGLAQIQAETAIINGSILADGQIGWPPSYPGSSGGGILMNLNTLTGNGLISAQGGKAYAGSGYIGGNGGGGRVAIYCRANLDFPMANISAQGGVNTWGAGQTGSVHTSLAPTFVWFEPSDPYFHGQEQISWAALAVARDSLHVTIGLYSVNAPLLLGQSFPQSGSFTLDTRLVPDGAYELRAEFYSPTGVMIGQASRNVLINNATIWHSGAILEDETWSPSQTHGVDGDLYINPGVTLTLEAGTVIKFGFDTRLVVMDGANLEATGAFNAPVILTSLSDDLDGGDSNLDGRLTVPLPGEWQGIGQEGAGGVNFNIYVEVRYARALHAGTILGNETWFGNFLHEISADVVIPSGVTVRIEPGAIVKFHPRTQIQVQAGGALVAMGNVAQPVSFTSLFDDSLGGDSNSDDDATLPAAGDWIGIQVAGSATFDHVVMAYGAGSKTGKTTYPTSTFLSIANGANVQVSNSLLRDGLFEGVVDRGSTQFSNTLILRTERAINLDSSSTLVNVTLDSNRIGLWCHYGGAQVTNAIISNSLESGVSGNCATLSYSNVWSTTGSNYTGTDQTGLRGNVSVDPQFKNANGDQFQLRFLSPMIDAGDGTAAPATDRMGAPRYDDPRVANTGLPDAQGAYADMGAFEFVENAESPIDLVVEGVSAPSEVLAGEWVTVSWEVRNIGLMTDTLIANVEGLETDPEGIDKTLYQVIGPWHDQISLVAQIPLRGVLEIPVAEVLSQATLGPGQSQIFQAVVRVPGGTEGQWRWRVKTNVRGEVFEGRNWQNNGSPLSAESILQVPVLTPGAPLPGIFEATGQANWYKFEQPASQAWTIQLDLNASTGRTRLYAGYGSMPTPQDYDQINLDWNTPDAVLDLPAAGDARTVYLLAMPEKLEAVNSPYTIQATQSAFTFQGLGLAQAGNAGPVTVPIYGGGFTAQLQASLNLNSTWISATQVVLLNSMSALATFDLTGAAEGLYTLKLQQEGASLTQNAIFAVIAGSGGQFEARLLVPTNVRLGRVINGLVEFANTGDADLAVPLMILQASAQNPIWLDADWHGGETLQLLGAPTQGMFNGVLSPGQRFSLRFLSRIGSNSVTYAVAWKDAASADPMDWDSLGAAILGDAPPLRQQAWQALTQEIGSASGAYIQALTQAYEEARGYGVELPTVRSILLYMLERQTVRLPGAVVSGIVVDAASGGPVGRAVVLLVDQASGDTYLAQAWYDGSFALRDAPAGEYHLIVQDYQPNPWGPISLGGAPVGGLQVAVSPGAQLSGSILDAAGYPVYNAALNLQQVNGGKVYATRSDGLGAYTFRGLPDGTYLLDIIASGYVFPGSQTLELKAGQVNGFSLVLYTGGGISGVVKTPAGIPLAGAQVRPLPNNPATVVFQVATTGADGSYHLTGLATGIYQVQATASGYGAASLENVPVTIGADTQGMDLTLTTPAAVSGLVLADEDGQPLANATLSTDAPRYGDDPVVTNPQGQYILEGLPAGVYHLWALAEDRVTQGVTLTLTGGQNQVINFNLHKLGSIQGVLETTSGTPIADIPITLMAVGLQKTVQNTSPAGEFLFTNLQDGHYILSIGDDFNQVVERHEFDLDATQNNYQVTLTQDMARLTGKVLEPGGAPVAQAVIGLLKDGNLVSTAATDEAGVYHFLVYTSGPVDIVAISDQAGILRLNNLQINPGDAIQAPDLVGGNASLTVQVQEDSPGFPAVEGATIVLKQGWGEPFPGAVLFGTSAEDGSYQFSSLAEGDYELTVLAPGLEATRRDLTLGAAGATETFALRDGRNLIGVVWDQDQRPIQGALVQAVDQANGMIHNAVTNAIGYYEMSSLPSGEFDVWVSAYGHGYARLGVVSTQAVGTVSANATLGTMSSAITGEVTDASGLPLLNGTVRAINLYGQPMLVSFTDLAGSYEMASLPEGALTLHLAAPGYLHVTQPVTVTAGSDLVINADLGQLIAQGMASSSQALFLDMKAYGPQPQGVEAMNDWQNWLLGTPPDPQRANKDTPEWRYSFYNYYPSDSCPIEDKWAFQDARDRAEQSAQQVDKTYLRWLQQHSVVKKLATTSVDAAFAQSAEILVKTAELLVAFNGSGVFNSATALEGNSAALAGDISLIKSATTDLIDGINSGDFQTADYCMGILETKGLGMIESAAGGPYISGPTAIVDIIKKIKQLYDDIDESTRWTLEALGQYRQTEDWYRQALSNHLANIEAVKAAARVCPTPTPTATRFTPTATPTGPTPTKTPYLTPTPQPTGTQQPCANPPCRTPLPPTPPKPTQGPTTKPTIGASSDPNEKVSIGVGAQGFILPGTTLIYTIYFENIAEASAAAQEVHITDALSDQLDWSSVELISIGFNQVVLNLAPGLQQYTTHAFVATDPNPVQVMASLDPETGVLTWDMITIDPVTGQLTEDPLAGFLPPNDAEGRGEGFVIFSVKPLATLTNGAVIQNQARIIFDVNPPIDTQVVVNTIDSQAPTSQVNPLPATSSTTFILSWSGDDGAGSGAAAYNIYVAVDGGAFVLWLGNTQETEARFSGQAQHTYAFYSTAVDAVGNREAAPASADTQTYLINQIFLPLTRR